MSSVPKSLQLKPLEMPDLPPTIGVPAEGLSLGRDPANAVVLSAERFPHVSSHHARLLVEEEELVVEDLGSRNGTLVNGREVKRSLLRAGDVLQLGRNVGPRFVVVVGGRLNSTLMVSQESRAPIASELGSGTVLHLRQVLGIPEDQKLFRKALGKQHRRLLGSVALVLLAISIAVGYSIFLDRSRRKQVENLSQLNHELALRIERTKEDVALQQEAWERQKALLENERTTLQDELQKLEKNEQTSSAEMEALHQQLSTTSAKLELMKPISLEKLEQERQAALRKNLDAVVLIERKVFFRNKKSGERLYLSTDSTGSIEPNFERRGEVLFEEVGGSGFCISEAGWIVTNAHVVAALDSERGENLLPLNLEPDVELAVVFSSTAVRHPAKVVQMARENENDLALLRIEPFEGMPHVKTVDLKAPLPVPGTELRVLGFPYGKKIPQEGDTVSASVFGGVASRKVGPMLQVHAAIYPGNSGGPVMDPLGNVVGIVTSVQTLPGGQISEIGFVIPIARLAEIWPVR